MTCHKEEKPSRGILKSIYAYLPAVVVAILPKCPFCIMAYTGAMTLCSGKTYYPNLGGWSGYLTLGISLFVILGIIMNKRGKRTTVATVIAVTGVALIGICQFLYISMPLYYLGVVLLFFGIWYNGSFFYFANKFLMRIKMLKVKSIE